MSKEYLNRPANTPEEIVGLIGNFGNRPDQRELQEYQVRCIKEFAVKAIQDIVLESSEYARERVEKLRAEPQVGVTGTNYNIIINGRRIEFDDNLTEEEIAKHFGEPTPARANTVTPLVDEELISREKAQDNSNDIYKVAARVKNLARSGGANLTPTGESLCNTYVHVLKAFYDFADKLTDQTIKDNLTKLIRSHEDMAGNFIASASVGVKARSGK